MSKNLEILVKNEFDLDEAENAKSYWAQVDINYYKSVKPWTTFMVSEILKFTPVSVFEFGCNAGKNLIALKESAGHIFISGADINKEAIEYGVSHNNLSLICADETILKVMPDKAFDVVFTVSVLDHVPDPKPLLANLARISKKAILLLEPFSGTEGKVIKNTDRQTGEWINTTPFSYSWDYENIAKDLLPNWSLTVSDYTLDSNLGRYYKFYKFVRDS